jgi:hypothetical protein
MLSEKLVGMYSTAKTAAACQVTIRTEPARKGAHDPGIVVSVRTCRGLYHAWGRGVLCDWIDAVFGQ